MYRENTDGPRSAATMARTPRATYGHPTSANNPTSSQNTAPTDKTGGSTARKARTA
jgi:hypothetical protein